jgi:hypothetical protein
MSSKHDTIIIEEIEMFPFACGKCDGEWQEENGTTSSKKDRSMLGHKKRGKKVPP